MDSLTQMALGASIGVAVMGRRCAPWKAALWGGVAGLLPDLDVLVDHGDAVLNMVRHRAESHSLLFLALLAGPMGWAVARWHGPPQYAGRWALALLLALVTHPLLDLMTVYGTQVWQPFTDEAYGLGSVFIIDPAYSLPLLIGLGLALGLRQQPARGLALNRFALALSCAYLLWSALAQAWVVSHARASLLAQGLPSHQLLVTPTPFNTVLWRVVSVDGGAYHEGFYSLLDRQPTMRFRRFDRGGVLLQAHQTHPQVQRLARFSDGFFMLSERDGALWMSDLRMGQAPYYVFNFNIGGPLTEGEAPPPAFSERQQLPLREGLWWLGRRMLGIDLDPPAH